MGFLYPVFLYTYRNEGNNDLVCNQFDCQKGWVKTLFLDICSCDILYAKFLTLDGFFYK